MASGTPQTGMRRIVLVSEACEDGIGSAGTRISGTENAFKLFSTCGAWAASVAWAAAAWAPVATATTMAGHDTLVGARQLCFKARSAHVNSYTNLVSGVSDSFYEYGQMITGGLFFLQGLADGVYEYGAVEFRDKGSDKHDIEGLLVLSSVLEASASAPLTEFTCDSGGDVRPAL